MAGDSRGIKPVDDPTQPQAGSKALTGRRSSAGRQERRLFFCTAATIVVFVLFDAFVSLAPGAGRSHHIARAVVPIAAVALAAWFYSRRRAGLRASVCLLFGVLALAAGALSVTGAGASGATAARLDRLPAHTGGTHAAVSRALAPLDLAQARRTLVSAPAPPERRRAAGRLLVRAPRQPGASRDPSRPHHDRRRRPGSFLRGGQSHDKRRPATRRLVRALAERRRGDHLPERVDRGARIACWCATATACCCWTCAAMG